MIFYGKWNDYKRLTIHAGSQFFFIVMLIVAGLLLTLHVGYRWRPTRSYSHIVHSFRVSWFFLSMRFLPDLDMLSFLKSGVLFWTSTNHCLWKQDNIYDNKFISLQFVLCPCQLVVEGMFLCISNRVEENQRRRSHRWARWFSTRLSRTGGPNVRIMSLGWCPIKCLGHDTSLRQHYKRDAAWRSLYNQTPSWCDWKIVESDVKSEQTVS